MKSLKDWLDKKEPHHLVLAFICILLAVMVALIVNAPTY